MYFAEQDHLVNYGKPITGDTYIKMTYGPVPSYIKDKVERAIDEDGSVSSNGTLVIANDYPDMDELSESDVESLDKAILENKDKSFSQLTKESHKEAWTKAVMAGNIDVFEIAKEAKADDGILDYIKNSIESNSSFS